MGKRMEAEQIRDCLRTFVKAWESGNGDLLDRCIQEEIYAYFSIFGNCYTGNGLKQWLCNPAEKDEEAEMRLYNETSLICGEKAYQYAALIGFFAERGKEKVRHIGFGGSFCNVLKKTDGKWRLETIRFELQSDDGMKAERLSEDGRIICEEGPGDRTMFGGWKFVNDRVGLFMDPVEGQGEHVIMAELDAPWFLAKEKKTEEDAREQIMELFSRYCFAYDFSCFLLMRDIFLPDAVICLGAGEEVDVREGVARLKLMRQGSPRSFHAGKLEKADIGGDRAVCEVVRMSPEKLLLTETEEGRLKADFQNGTYRIQLKKRDGEWKINRLEYRKNG